MQNYSPFSEGCGREKSALFKSRKIGGTITVAALNAEVATASYFRLPCPDVRYLQQYDAMTARDVIATPAFRDRSRALSCALSFSVCPRLGSYAEDYAAYQMIVLRQISQPRFSAQGRKNKKQSCCILSLSLSPSRVQTTPVTVSLRKTDVTKPRKSDVASIRRRKPQIGYSIAELAIW